MEKRHSKWARLLLLSSKWEWLVLMSKWGLRLLLPWLLLSWQSYEKWVAVLISTSFTFNSTGCTDGSDRSRMAAHKCNQPAEELTHMFTHWIVYAKKKVPFMCTHTHTHLHSDRFPNMMQKHLSVHVHNSHTETQTLTWRTPACVISTMSDGADGGNSVSSLKQNK